MRILLANFAKMVNDSGGLAKVHCAFANEMQRSGHSVLMMYSDDREGEFFYPVDAGVELCNLRHVYGKDICYPKSYKLRREVLRLFSKKKARAINDRFTEKYLLPLVKTALDEFAPDIIVCFQPASSKTFLCDLNVTDIPVITMSHGDPEDYFHTYPPEELPSLGKSAVCQVLVPSFAEAIKKRFPEVKVRVIGNVVPQYEEQADLSAKKNVYKIIFVGRLTRNHNRPHLLIDAFSRVAEEFPNWTVEIWGAQDRKSYSSGLEKQIKNLGLTKQVFIKGATHDVKSVLQHGDLFAFPSAYEGFGLSAAEAMSMGLPVVAFRSCSGVNELIEDGVSGFLCEDGAEDFAEKMASLMKDANLRARMGAAAREAMKKYSADKIWSAWQSLLREVAGKK